MRVGLLGVQFDNPNLGVEALAYSVLGIVREMVAETAEFVVFSRDGRAALDSAAEVMGIDGRRLVSAPIRHRHLGKLHAAMRSCDVIVELTGGDSFADIYGLRRLLVNLTDKQVALWSGTPLVIAPQTIGPFQRRLVRPAVGHVLNKAALVAVRDELSRDLVVSLTRREVLVATDVALALPRDPHRYRRSDPGKAAVGVNVSGLLWNGGYTGDNQFGLRADYRQYCDLLVDQLLAGGLDIHLVPHVIGREGALDEDDVTACEAVRAAHPACTVAPRFGDPVDAKSYIASLDVLVGARMHATIAAFTSGVATVPVAYSRKFAGYYSNLGYSDLVDLASLDTESAVAQTVRLVHERDRLRQAAQRSREIAGEKLAVFTRRLKQLLASLEDSRGRGR